MVTDSFYFRTIALVLSFPVIGFFIVYLFDVGGKNPFPHFFYLGIESTIPFLMLTDFATKWLTNDSKLNIVIVIHEFFTFELDK
ncbi:MAG: hypothetical protein SFU98_08200 [Leptospiraceae bacterium]|nr:hypothetical protein [Leptospiraceae bacterium]